MVSEGEVTCGVIKWLIEIQKKWDEDNKKIIMGFWICDQNVGLACRNAFEEEKINSIENLKLGLISEYRIEESYLNRHFLGQKDFRIVWDYRHKIIPDIMVHVYYINEAYSEIWAIECKGDQAKAIRDAFRQVIVVGRAVSKSLVALSKEKVNLVEELKDLGYGVLSYDPEIKAIPLNEQHENIRTSAKPKFLNPRIRELRDIHLKQVKVSSLEDAPFMQSRISTKVKVALALHIFYNQGSYNGKNGDQLAQNFSQELGLGQTGTGISKISMYTKDLKIIRIIDDDFKLYDIANEMLKMLDTILEGTTPLEKLNYYKENLIGSGIDALLIKVKPLGYQIAKLLTMYLRSYKEIKELIGWIRQASIEANTDKPTLAHVFTVALNDNPVLVNEFLLAKRQDDTARKFQYNKTRSQPNRCALCDKEYKIDFCFGEGDFDEMTVTDHSSSNPPSSDEVELIRLPFQKRYDEFHEVWNNNLLTDLFTDEELRKKYIREYTYPNGSKIDILMPCFIKSIINTNFGKMLGLLRHAGILGAGVRSGLKAEICVRNDLLYLRPESEDDSIEEEEEEEED